MVYDHLVIDNIEYTIDRAKRKNIYICIKSNNVIVKVPKYIKNEQIYAVIDKKKHWILKKLSETSKVNKFDNEYVDGEILNILGKKYFLNLQYTNISNSTAMISNDKIIVGVNSSLMNKLNSKELIKKEVEIAVYKLYFDIVREEVNDSINKFCHITNLYPKNVRIKKLKSSWGLCSSTKNITINVELVKFTRTEIDYVVLHEICHLKYMNHSEKFWNLVEKYMPDYKTVKKNLKVHMI